MNRVLLVGRTTRDPELRALASGRMVASFSVVTHDTRDGADKDEYTPIVAWDMLAEVVAKYVTKGMKVAIDGRLQTRQWDDEQGHRHWRTEVVATSVELLSGRKAKPADEPMGTDGFGMVSGVLGGAS